jgi:predicted AlkP superfamily pyrophosphatase or phosphodiesterase
MRTLTAALLWSVLATAIGGAQGTGGINAPAQRDKPYVVLISFDGFKPEYLQRIELPNFQRVMRSGVRSEGMIPVFPSLTFPNHVSIVTGMYADRHGIVSNTFWDPQRNATYSIGDSMSVRDGSWYRGEPIWVTAEKQGMVAASFFWVASETEIAGVRPTFYKNYDSRTPNTVRIDSVLSWLGMPTERRPHMVTLYFGEVDGAGHRSGPLSPQVDTAAWNVDAALGRLLDGIQRLPPSVRDRVYVVLVSDHGMSETSSRWFAALDTLIDLQGVRIADRGPVASLHVTGGLSRARVLRDSINRRMRHGRAYIRSEMPLRFHYSADPRGGDLVVVMDDHFQIGTADRPPRDGGATHGWDPAFSSMHAIFVATGPGIPAGKTIPVFENVHVYPWLTELLRLRPGPGIDGRKGRLAALIKGAR